MRRSRGTSWKPAAIALLRSRFDLDVVWRIRVHEMDGGAVEQAIHVLRLAAVAAEQAMLPKHPKIARLRDRFVRRLGHLVGVGLSCIGLRPSSRAVRRPRSRSGPGRSPSPASWASSRGSLSSSHCDSVAVWLSAIRYALTWAGLKPTATWTGTSSRPSFNAALYRVWPTMMTPSSSTTIGCRKPNSRMDAATASTAGVVEAGVVLVGPDGVNRAHFDVHGGLLSVRDRTRPLIVPWRRLRCKSAAAKCKKTGNILGNEQELT